MGSNQEFVSSKFYLMIKGRATVAQNYLFSDPNSMSNVIFGNLIQQIVKRDPHIIQRPGLEFLLVELQSSKRSTPGGLLRVCRSRRLSTTPQWGLSRARYHATRDVSAHIGVKLRQYLWEGYLLTMAVDKVEC